MSQNLDLSNEHPQPPAEATAIGVTYVPSSENSTLRRVMEEAESQVILRALQHTGWNREAGGSDPEDQLSRPPLQSPPAQYHP